MANAKWIQDELKRSFAKASRTGKKSMLADARAKNARYDAKNGRVVVELFNGCVFAFPPRLAQGLEDASDRALSEIEVTSTGYGLHWPQLDADLSVPGLVAGIFGTRPWMREIARRGGVVRSSAKASAARENGKKGGRPPNLEKRSKGAIAA